MSLNGDNFQKTLVIGIGNTLRSDDGVGPYVADCIEAKGIKNVKVWVTQQLHVEDLEPMLEFGRIILIDASLSGPPLDLRRVDSVKGQSLSSSHHLSAETFINLAKSIYHKDISMQLCSIKGHRFEVGDTLTPDVRACAKQAVELICSQIKG